MIRKPFFSYMFLSLIFLGITNIIATKFDLYWSVFGFDKFAHFVAGVSIGYFFFWVYLWLVPVKYRHRRHVFWGSLLFIILVGVFWEVFEYYIGEGGFHKDAYWQDTIWDIICDVGGTIFALLTARRKIARLIRNP